MSDATPGISSEDVPVQPLRGNDTSIDPEDPAQAEWEATLAADAGAEPDVETATGGDPAELPSDDDDVPREDQHLFDRDVETQGTDPVDAELGEDGQGDLAPEDL
jgi:hypothetical protein